jgi:hypothetical protein
MDTCSRTICKKEYQATQAHGLKTKELSVIFANFTKATKISDINKLYKDFKKIIFKSPHITHFKCVYNNCNETMIKSIESVLKLFETLYNSKNKVVLQTYALIILDRCHKLLDKNKHTTNEIIQIAFYTILLTYLYTTNIINK